MYPAEPVLSWRNPVGGWRVGRAAAASDLVIVVHYTTIQAPVPVGGRAGSPPRCAGRRDLRERRPARSPARRPAAHRAADAGGRRGRRAHRGRAPSAERPSPTARWPSPRCPPHLPDGPPRPRAPGVRRRLLFFGKVRRYKGLDVLLRALAQLDGVHLTVAGEVYPDATDLGGLVDRLGLRDRVDLRPGYLPAERIPDLFASVDALVLPYRSATASQHVALANRHRVPVVATRVGNFPDVIDDGVDGLLCAPGDVADLTRALRELYAPGRLDALRAAAPVSDDEQVWKTYLETLLTVDGDDRRMPRGQSAAGRFARLEPMGGRSRRAPPGDPRRAATRATAAASASSRTGASSGSRSPRPWRCVPASGAPHARAWSRCCSPPAPRRSSTASSTARARPPTPRPAAPCRTSRRRRRSPPRTPPPRPRSRRRWPGATPGSPPRSPRSPARSRTAASGCGCTGRRTCWAGWSSGSGPVASPGLRLPRSVGSAHVPLLSRARRALRWPARPDHRRGGGRRSPGRTPAAGPAPHSTACRRSTRAADRSPWLAADVGEADPGEAANHPAPAVSATRRPRSAQRRRARGRRAGARPGPTGRARTRGSAARSRSRATATASRLWAVAAARSPRSSPSRARHEVRPAAVRVVVDQGAAAKDLDGWPCRQGRGRRWPARGRT